MPVRRHSIAHSEENARARTFEFFYRGRVSLRAGKHPFSLFKGQRSSQGLVVVAGTVVDALNGRFPFDVAVRKLVVIPPIRVKDRFDDGRSSSSSTYPWSLFFVIVVESLHDVLPKGLLAEIPLFVLPFVLRHELSERAKEAKVQNICIG